MGNDKQQYDAELKSDEFGERIRNAKIGDTLVIFINGQNPTLWRRVE